MDQPAALDEAAAVAGRGRVALAARAARRDDRGRAAARGHRAVSARAFEDAEGDGRGEPLLLRGAGDLRRESRTQEFNAESLPLLAGARCAGRARHLGRRKRSTARSGAGRNRARRGLGKIAQPLRVAVSGGGVSPPIDQTLAILGRARPWHASSVRSTARARSRLGSTQLPVGIGTARVREPPICDSPRK